MKQIMHFSIQKTAHKSGDHCLIVKIYKRGYFNGKIYKQPVLNNKNFIFAKCLSVKNNIKYANLSNKDFRYSLSNIKNVNALKKGLVNLERHINNIKKFGINPIVAINHFILDTKAEIKIISDFCKKLNVEVSECTHWANGGKGTKDLAKKVVKICKNS